VVLASCDRTEDGDCAGMVTCGNLTNFRAVALHRGPLVSHALYVTAPEGLGGIRTRSCAVPARRLKSLF